MLMPATTLTRLPMPRGDATLLFDARALAVRQREAVAPAGRPQ